MNLPFLDPGFLLVLGLVVLCLLGFAANAYGADSQPSESSDHGPSQPLGHKHHV